MSKRILITSGPTRAPFDAVRFLTNRSTGRFGTLLVQEALRRGAKVTLVYGVGSETPPAHPHLRKVPIETNEDLARVLQRELRKGSYDAVIHAMAVLDFAPAKARSGKTSSRGSWVVRLIPTPKVISRIKRWAPEVFLVGFKLEVGLDRKSLVSRGLRLLAESGADLVVANQLPSGEDRRHAAYLLSPDRYPVRKLVGKRGLARGIIREVLRGRR